MGLTDEQVNKLVDKIKSHDKIIIIQIIEETIIKNLSKRELQDLITEYWTIDDEIRFYNKYCEEEK
jgi:hypothetical protein